MTTALEGGEWSAARPGRTLPPGKTRNPFYRKLGGPQGRSGWAENLVPTGIRSRTVQSIVNHYTDWATWPTIIQWYIVINVQASSCKYPLFLSDFNQTWIFSTDFQKILKYQISWKSVVWERSLSMRTDMTQQIVTFCNFAKKPNEEYLT